MKKNLSMILALSLMCLFAASCSNKEAPPSQATDDRTEALQSSESIVSADYGTKERPTERRGVDVDLTVLSSTMVYAEVNNIMTSPKNYVGKTIKMNGLYYASYFDQTDQYYHYVVITDATSCCPQGLEFTWDGNHAYPDDYPEDQANIEVIGVFDSYDELGQTYYYLDVNDLSVLS